MEKELLKAALNLSDILHELEDLGIELTESQDERWADATMVIQAAMGNDSLFSMFENSEREQRTPENT